LIYDADTRANRLRTVNSQLTRLIIRYHEEGYTENFFINGINYRLYLLRDQNLSFPFFSMKFVSQCHDGIMENYKYIHIIENELRYKRTADQ